MVNEGPCKRTVEYVEWGKKKKLVNAANCVICEQAEICVYVCTSKKMRGKDKLSSDIELSVLFSSLYFLDLISP